MHFHDSSSAPNGIRNKYCTTDVFAMCLCGLHSKYTIYCKPFPHYLTASKTFVATDTHCVYVPVTLVEVSHLHPAVAAPFMLHPGALYKPDLLSDLWHYVQYTPLKLFSRWGYINAITQIALCDIETKTCMANLDNKHKYTIFTHAILILVQLLLLHTVDVP